MSRLLSLGLRVWRHINVLVLLKATMKGTWVLCIEVWRALTRSEKFKGSREELTPVR